MPWIGSVNASHRLGIGLALAMQWFGMAWHSLGIDSCMVWQVTSDKEQSDKEQSDKEQSDKEHSDKEQGNSDQMTTSKAHITDNWIDMAIAMIR